MAKPSAKKTQTEVTIPTLEDIVVTGENPVDSEPLPVALSAEQMQRLSREISKELQAYLDKNLPKLLESVLARREKP